MIEETYISFEIAKLLKKKGFDEPCLWGYDPYGASFARVMSEPRNSELNEYEYSKPTQQMAMKWLREVHQLHIMVNCIGKVNYDPIIQRFDGKDFEVDGVVFGTTKRINGKYVNVRRGFKTYEDACEAAIKYCLENLI